jgi:hypothetical protein
VFLNEFNANTPHCECLYGTAQIVEIAGQPVHAMNDNRIAVTNECEHVGKRRTFDILA